MIVGILFVLAACFVWGFIFLIPLLLSDFNSMEIALNRYLFFGLFSLFLLTFKGWKVFRQFTPRMYLSALAFALIAQLGYYTALVLGIRCANAAVTTLILGITPLTIAFYGNWQMRECSFRSLLLPSLLLCGGLVVVNIPVLQGNSNIESISMYFLGLLFVLFALVSWTWFAVHNARILHKNMQLAASDWSSLVGLGTLIGVILIGGTASTLGLMTFDFGSYPLEFWLGGFALGVVCSWLGFYLWNRGSILLPVSLAGQLMIFETIFGLVFVYLYETSWPSALEWMGMALMLSGIFMSVNTFRKQEI
jgi:drug/metabolite transporter (DMT)-like permease